ncbi:actin cytoskeleton-regulatory complex protein END3-domain-containing protein [Dipodascopsis uninucleata]
MATLSSNKLEEWEIAKYWEIFSGLNPQNGLLTGEKAATVLKNSKLDDNQLAKIWDLSDLDNDGNLDFEEFCVSMRLIFDMINGSSLTNISKFKRYKEVPDKLPDWLIPSSKVHLIHANSDLKMGSLPISRIDDDFDDSFESGLSNDFDWYMAPSDKRNYEAIYTANADRYGQITFASLTELYGSLNVPDSDIRAAWSIVNPNSERSIGKDQTLAFLHILNNRDKGVRVPRKIPASLRATFEKSTKIDYDLSSTSSVSGRDSRLSKDYNTPSARKAAFADSYLDRLGISSGKSTRYNTSGTDFSSTKDTDWEEVRLRRQLTDLENQLEKAEQAAQRRKLEAENNAKDTKISLVKSQLEQLYDYKRKQLRKFRSSDQSDINLGTDVSGIKQEISVLKQQVDLFEDYCNRKQGELNQLYSEIEREKN